MKRMKTCMLPTWGSDDPKSFKSVLEDSYKLKVVAVNDISKPTAKPIEEIDEPEDEEVANENKSAARMLHLKLKDDGGTEINAIETERIESLSSVKPNWKIFIEGPIVVRCGNMLMEKKHVTAVEPESRPECITID